MSFVYSIHPQNPQKRIIDKAVSILKKGGVIIYPTDTTYGLGADITEKKAIERILKIKGESKFKALSFICDDFSNIHQYVKISDKAFKIMKRCLPGSFTFVLQASKIVPKLMIHRQKTAGIRVPDYPFCRHLVQELGNPIVSTSLPKTGEIEYENTEEIIKIFKNQVDMIINAGFLGSLPSTVVDLQHDEINIIREGAGDINLLY